MTDKNGKKPSGRVEGIKKAVDRFDKPDDLLPPEYINKADEVEDQEIQFLFQEVVQEVPWSGFRHCPIELFKRIRQLATLDLWSEVEEKRKAIWIRQTIGELKRLRNLKIYKEIKAALVEAMDKVLQPSGYKEHIEDKRFQDRLIRRQKRLAMYGKDEKSAGRAVEVLADRVAPRAMPGQQAIIINIDEKHSRMISETLEQSREIRAQVKEVKQLHGVREHDHEEGSDGAEGGGEA